MSVVMNHTVQHTMLLAASLTLALWKPVSLHSYEDTPKCPQGDKLAFTENY